MTKLLLLLSFLALVFLSLGTVLIPNDAIFWLASTGPQVHAMRIGFEVILLILLLTDPPRHMITRLSTSFIAIGLGVYALQSSLPSLDGLAFLSASIAVLITSLELKTDKIKAEQSLTQTQGLLSSS